MYYMLSIVPKILIIPVIIYFYFSLKRLFHLFKMDIDLIKVKFMVAILSFVFVWPANYIWGIWAVVVFHFFFFSIFFDGLYWLLQKYIKEKNIFKKVYDSLIIPFLCVLLVLGYGYWNMNHVSMTHYTLYTQKNIKQDYKIAFLSDLHFGNTMDQKTLEKYCEDISSYHPDIVLLGGDIVDEKTSFQDMQDAFMTLGQIENKYGIYYVYGNHDQAAYSPHPPFTADELRQTILKNKMIILADRSYQIQDDFSIVGRLDRNSRKNSSREDSMQLLNHIDQNDFTIMLDHQPVDLELNDDLKYDLQISGHTHGGQIFPVGVITDKLGFGEMNYGYRKMKHMQVIVSSGIAGWGYPLRTGSQSEYVIVDIVKNK